jgi:hypothetical protein
MGLFSDETYNVKRMVFAFRPASARILIGDEDPNRICHIPGMGGVAIMQDSLYPYRRGHIFWPCRDELHANHQRQVTLCMFIRQDDPNPLSLAAGWETGYQGGHLNHRSLARIQSNSARTAVADHKRKGRYRDKLTAMLALILAVSAITAGLVWLSVPVMGFVK